MSTSYKLDPSKLLSRDFYDSGFFHDLFQINYYCNSVIFPLEMWIIWLWKLWLRAMPANQILAKISLAYFPTCHTVIKVSTLYPIYFSCKAKLKTERYSTLIIRKKSLLIKIVNFRDVNDMIMEMLVMAYACKTSTARRIIGVIPYVPYSRQCKNS